MMLSLTYHWFMSVICFRSLFNQTFSALQFPQSHRDRFSSVVCDGSPGRVGGFMQHSVSDVKITCSQQGSIMILK